MRNSKCSDNTYIFKTGRYTFCCMLSLSFNLSCHPNWYEPGDTKKGIILLSWTDHAQTAYNTWENKQTKQNKKVPPNHCYCLLRPEILSISDLPWILLGKKTDKKAHHSHGKCWNAGPGIIFTQPLKSSKHHTVAGTSLISSQAHTPPHPQTPPPHTHTRKQKNIISFMVHSPES